MISFSIKMKFIPSLQLFDFAKGLKNVETAVVNELSMLEPKKAKTDTLHGGRGGGCGSPWHHAPLPSAA